MGIFLLWATWAHEYMAIFVKIDGQFGVRPQLRIALVAMLTFCLIIRKRDHYKF